MGHCIMHTGHWTVGNCWFPKSAVHSLIFLSIQNYRLRAWKDTHFRLMLNATKGDITNLTLTVLLVWTFKICVIKITFGLLISQNEFAAFFPLELNFSLINWPITPPYLATSALVAQNVHWYWLYNDMKIEEQLFYHRHTARQCRGLTGSLK